MIPDRRKPILKVLALIIALICVLALPACELGGTEDKTTTTEKGNGHEHTPIIDKAVEPTCTEPGKTEGSHCFDCGEVIVAQQEIPAKGHTLGEWTVDKEASCTEEGEKHAECISCHGTVTESIPLAKHIEGEWITDKEPSCTEEGSKHTECTVCHATLRTETIDKEEHTEQVIPGVEATCTSTGLTQGLKCSVCGEILIKQTTIPTTGKHTEEKIPGKYATCGETGLTDGVKCSVCGEILTKQTIIPATGNHTEEKIPGKDATCTETGLTDGVKCSVCGKILIAQTTISKKDHIESDWIIDTEATEETDGSKHTECTVCHTKIKTETIPATASRGLEFTLNSDGKSYSVTGIGTCKDTELVIPSTYNSKPVTGIGSSAFKNCTSLTSVTIPHSVTSISEQAFYNCNLLTRATIGDGVTYIGERAFQDCVLLANVNIPDAVTNISNYAFLGCKLLPHVTISDNVISIGHYAFNSCTSLTSITVDRNNKYYESIDGNLYTKSEKALLQYAIGKKDAMFTIPDSVAKIGDGAFSRCTSLTTVTIPDSVTSIGSSACYSCISLTSVTIPDSVTSIGDTAFWGCSSLTSVTIPNSITSIGNNAFYNCYSLIEVCNKSYLDIVAGSYKYGYIATYAKHVINDESASHLKTVGDYIFYDDGENIYLVKYFGSDTDITLPEYDGRKNYEIWKSAFYENDKIASVIIPNSVTSIGNGAFADCKSLTSVTIPNSLTSIGSGAFYDCTSLTSVIIPDSVTSIGEYAFSGCYTLIEVCNKSSLNIVAGASSCGNIAAYTKHVIKDESESCLKTVEDYIFYDDGENIYLVKYIGNDTEITLPKYAKGKNYEIYQYAFYKNDKITSVTIPDNVTSIGDDAFRGCTSLTSISIPNSLTSIGNNTFSDCTSLTSVTIPDSVTSIGWYAFHGCFSLKYNEYDNAYYLGNESNPYFALIEAKNTKIANCIIHPDTKVVIRMVFEKCTFLKDVYYLGTIEDWCNINFSDLYSNPCLNGANLYINGELLTDLVIPDNVTNINNAAFRGCTSLTSVTIPNSVTSIGYGALSSCTSLTEIHYIGTISQWNSITKGSIWNYNTGSYTIYCTDGEISK